MLLEAEVLPDPDPAVAEMNEDESLVDGECVSLDGGAELYAAML